MCIRVCHVQGSKLVKSLPRSSLLIIEVELPGASHIWKLEFPGERFVSVCVQGPKLVKSLPRSSLLAQPMLGQRFLETATALLIFAINAPRLPESPAGSETISGICHTLVPYICFCHGATQNFAVWSVTMSHAVCVLQYCVFLQG